MITMKVAVIAAELEGRATGVGRYLGGLLGGLERWDHGVEWHLFFQGDPSPSLPAAGDTIHTHFSHHRGSRVVWEQLVVSRAVARISPDLLFGPAYTVPFGLRVPAAVALHDLSFEILPEEFELRERWRRRLLARRAARVARRVITDTAHLASLVGGRYGVPAGRLSVVPLGVDAGAFSPRADTDDVSAVAGLGIRRPYALLPGTVLERRLPRTVLEAFAVVRRDRPQLELVIAGANRMRNPQRLDGWVREFGLEGAVHALGWVAEPALAPLYRGAEVGIYVSRHEGFGLPPLELLACGTPVVVSTGLGLDEAWPDYPYRVHDLRADSIAAQVMTALTDGELRARTVVEASRVLTHLDWEESSRRLVAELRGAVSP